MSGPRANIVVIFSDQQRADTLGCYGQPLPVTPNLDTMAKEGVRFSHAFTPQPVCGPGRACIQTGLYATQTGCFRNNIALPTSIDTLATWLSAGGYEVGYIGKWHLASTGGSSAAPLEMPVNFRESAVPPERRGGYVDYWLAADALEYTSTGLDGGFMFDKDMNKVEFTGYRVDSQTDLVLDYLQSRDGTRPFFLFVSYLEPHHQNDRFRFEGPPGSKERWKDFHVPGDLVDTRGDWRESYPDYLGACNSIDQNLARIRDLLQQKGLDENTTIIYTTDHGCHFRTRNGEYKRSCHDASTRIPLDIHGPGFTGGVVVDGLVSLIDVAPTVLRIAGLPVPGTLQGRPLQDLVAGTAPDWPDDVFIQVSESHVGRALRTARWKYEIVAPGKNGSYHPSSMLYIEDCLYDLDHDPHERRNLVLDPAHAGTRAMLRERLVARMEQAGERIPRIVQAGRLIDDRDVNVSGHLHVAADGTVLMGVAPSMDINACPVDVPLGEILGEHAGERIELDVNGIVTTGVLQEGDEGWTFTQDGSPETEPLARTFGAVVGKMVSLCLLRPVRPGTVASLLVVPS